MNILLRKIQTIWTRGLKVGYDPSLPALLRSRVIMLNGILMLITLSVISFSVIYYAIGYRYYYGPLYILPFISLVFWSNHQKKFSQARNLYVLFSLLVISYWCLEGRGNGNEYTLIGLATTSTLLFDRKITMWLFNSMCAVLFVAFKLYNSYVPFVPDPAINYDIVPWMILINSVAIASFQMAFFQDLVHRYDGKLISKLTELNIAMEKQRQTEEKLLTSNERLHNLASELEIAVKRKSTELQSYVDAINVSIYSCTNDLTGAFLMVNEPLLSVSGYKREELVGRHYSLFDTGTPTAAEFRKRQEMLSQGKIWIGEIKSKKKNGSYFWYDCVVIPILDEKGSIECFLSLGIPSTERKLHEQMKEQTRTVLESIAFKTSHNIRGPLARIEGLSNLAMRDLINTQELPMIASKLIESSDDLKKATSELIRFVNDHRDSFEDGAKDR